MHIYQAPNVKTCVKVLQSFLLQAHFPIILAKQVTVAKCSPVWKLDLTCLLFNLALHSIDIFLTQFRYILTCKLVAGLTALLPWNRCFLCDFRFEKFRCVKRKQESRDPDDDSLETAIISQKRHERVGWSCLKMLHWCQSEVKCDIHATKSLNISKFIRFNREVIVDLWVPRKQTNSLRLVCKLVDGKL